MAGEGSERRLAGKRREPIYLQTRLKMDLETKEGAQAEEMQQNKKKPEDYHQMHVAVTRSELQYSPYP